MLSIKLKPIGKKGHISYRIVVAEARSKLKGRFVEDLGWYNPYTNEFKIDEEKTKKWLSSGAQATDSVHNLLVKAGVCPGPKKAVHSTKKKKIEEGSAVKSGGESAEKAEAPKQESTEKSKKPKEKPEEPEAPTSADKTSAESESRPLTESQSVGKKPEEKKPEEKKSDEESPQEENSKPEDAPEEEKPNKEPDKEKPSEENKPEENK